MLKKILYAVCVLGILAVIAYYVYEITVLKEPFTKNLIRAVGTLLTFALVIYKLASNAAPSRNSLSFYASTYAKELEGAFADNRAKRKKLIRAIREYSEHKPRKAVKILSKLFSEAQERRDIYACGLFLALSLTSMSDFRGAIRTYVKTIESNRYEPKLYNNLGSVYSRIGDSEKALESYASALEADPRHALTYSNIANHYFEQGRFEEAKDYAKKALDIEPSVYQSSTLLAIIAAMEGDTEEEKRYRHMAISCGQDAESLRRAIEYYTKNYK